MEFMEMLLFIKNTCENSKDCCKCPFGKYLNYYDGYTCGITYCEPSDWELNKQTIVRYFKEDTLCEQQDC